VDFSSGLVARLTIADQTAGTPDLAPGGAFVVYDSFPGNPAGGTGLWVVEVNVSSPPGRFLDKGGRLPVLTPDGTKVIVVDAGSPGGASPPCRLHRAGQRSVAQQGKVERQRR
jgi:hypothetical protein